MLKTVGASVSQRRSLGMTFANFIIPPHGGKLVNRIATEPEKQILKEKIISGEIKSISLNKRQTSNLVMLATGGFSPLEGFMSKSNYESVVNNMRLSNGLVFPIPITLAINKDNDKLKTGETVGLKDESKKILGILELTEKYNYDKELEAEKVYRTKDSAHPGVNVLYQQGEILIAGKITLFEKPVYSEFSKYHLTPDETREFFYKKGWKTIVAFQTRNPIHRAHEYIQKCALEIVDGLFIHPIVGETKSDDIPAEVRMKCYEVLLEKYYPSNHVVLAINPSNMYYAGPREAIFHAIVRKNYGATHFIVGRDHAGVGNYYGTYDAQKIFLELDEDELGIKPLFFENTFWCRKCSGMASIKTCPHPETEHFSLSGTKVRELLKSGEIPPVEFTRPEVANVLINWWKENGK